MIIGLHKTHRTDPVLGKICRQFFRSEVSADESCSRCTRDHVHHAAAGIFPSIIYNNIS